MIHLTDQDRRQFERLRDHLEKLQENHPVGFDMGTVIDPSDKNTCGAACCMIGHLVYLEDPSFFQTAVDNMTKTGLHSTAWMMLRERVNQILRCSETALNRLFYPDVQFYDVPPGSAARVVDHMLKTGEIDWDKAVEV